MKHWTPLFLPFPVARISGWWYTHPSEKYEFVSWDDDIPNIWKIVKFMFQTINQIWIVESPALLLQCTL